MDRMGLGSHSSSVGEVQHRAVGQDLEVGSTEECDRIARTSLEAGFLPDVPTALPSRLRELAVLGPLLNSVSVVQRSHSSCVWVAGSSAIWWIGYRLDLFYLVSQQEC